MKKIFYSILAVAAFCACQGLDQEPSTSVSTSTAIQSVEDLAFAVNGAYYRATYGDQLTMASELAIYADELGPDSNVEKGSGQLAERIHNRTVTSNDSFNAYAFLYRALANINKALEVAQTLEDQEAAAPYIAEMYGMRGLSTSILPPSLLRSRLPGAATSWVSSFPPRSIPSTTRLPVPPWMKPISRLWTT